MNLQDEYRQNILLTSFGYNSNGTLEVNLSNFIVSKSIFDYKSKKNNVSLSLWFFNMRFKFVN